MMKVQDTNLTGTSAAGAPPPGTITRPAGLPGLPSGQLGQGDRVEFSGFTGKLGAALAAQSADGAARVAALERDYQAGRYHPSAHDTSRALVTETLGVNAGHQEA